MITRLGLSKLNEEDLIDYALERDIDVLEEDTREDILDKLFGKQHTLSDIRDPVKHEVLKFLPIGDVSRFTRTSKEWQENQQLWEMLMQRDFKKSGTKLYYKECYLMERVECFATEMREKAKRNGLNLATTISKEKDNIFVWRQYVTKQPSILVKIDLNGNIFSKYATTKSGNLFQKWKDVKMIFTGTIMMIN